MYRRKRFMPAIIVFLLFMWCSLITIGFASYSYKTPVLKGDVVMLEIIVEGTRYLVSPMRLYGADEATQSISFVHEGFLYDFTNAHFEIKRTVIKGEQ